MTPFEFKSYREYLKSLCRQPSTERGFQAALAKAAGCQASYFSQVLQEKVHLTEDQAIGIAEHLEFSKREMEHFLLLLRLEKASTPKLRHYLEGRLKESIKDNQKIGQKVPAQKIVTDEEIGKYCGSWIPSVVHLLTSDPNHQTAKAISQRLNVPLKVVEETLNTLLEINFVDKKEGQWVYQSGSVHIPKNSPWQNALQTGRRQMALRSIAINPEEAIHFSSLFTIDPNDVEDIKKLVKPFLDKSHKIISKSGTQELYCLNLDLFPVI